MIPNPDNLLRFAHWRDDSTKDSSSSTSVRSRLPVIESMRSILKKSLARVPVDPIVEVLVGDYSSPTILVNAFDVTGCPRAPESQMSYWLDLSTEEQIIAADRGCMYLRPFSKRPSLSRERTNDENGNSLHVTVRYVSKLCIDM